MSVICISKMSTVEHYRKGSMHCKYFEKKMYKIIIIVA